MRSDPVLSLAPNGRLVYVWPDGKVLPAVRGGEGPTSVLDRQIPELRKQIDEAEGRARTAQDKIDEITAELEERAGKGENVLDVAVIKEVDARYREHDEVKGEATTEAAELRGALDRLLVRVGGTQLVSDLPRGGPDDGRPLSRKSRHEFAELARRYLSSPSYREMVESKRLTSGGKISHAPVEVLQRGDFVEGELMGSELEDALRQRATVNVGDAGAVVPIDQQVWPPVIIPVRQVRLLDLISMVTTDSDMVNFVQQSVRSDYAAETPYGTVAPEADYEFALKQASVKRVPTFIPATKDVLADQGQLQGLLQDELMMGVRLRLESQFLGGAGSSFTDNQFQGILNATGIGTVTYQSSGHSSEYQLDAYHRAITTIRLTLFADPTAIVVHPTDYEWAVLKRDSYGRYLFEPNTEADVQTLWGLQTVVSPVTNQGTALVGDFKTGARMWLRTGLSVTASTEHLDFFTRGMVAILAEMRAAFATIQPRAFCQVLSLTGP
jgi:HK97 family phage major capsid protein